MDQETIIRCDAPVEAPKIIIRLGSNLANGAVLEDS